MPAQCLVSPVKRVSIFCRDLDKSLAFYRDILGMKIIEDKTVSGPFIGKLVNLASCTMRIVYLQADPKIDAGLVGLFHVTEPKLPMAPRATPGQIHWGQGSFVFSTDHGDEIYAALQKAGTQFLTPPTPYTKPTDDAYMKAGVYTEMIFYDPDGLMVSIIGYKPLPK
ncbi:MAG: VOC family protein [Rhodospirillaceae bacterium]|nr:VOC family protein [Rhodospirillaceae bacterium]